MIALLVGAALAAPPGVAPFVDGLRRAYGQDGLTPDPAASAARYAEACAAGQALACHPESWTTVTWGPACDAGDPVACLVDGWLLNGGDRAADRLRTACALGVARGCADLGALYQHGVGVERRPERAYAQYGRACEAGDPSGCRRLGQQLLEADGVPRDSSGGIARLESACDAGDPPACVTVGALREGAGVPDAALDPLRRACDAGMALGCAGLGRVAATVPGALPPAELRRLDAIGCDAGVPASCLALGHDLLIEPLDPAGAAGALLRGCDLGLTTACVELGARELRGEGLPSAPDAGVAHLERACADEARDACATLALVFDEGLFVPVDEGRATGFFRAACDLNVVDACNTAADRLSRGPDADPAAAEAAWAHACELGDARACRRAKP